MSSGQDNWFSGLVGEARALGFDVLRSRFVPQQRAAAPVQTAAPVPTAPQVIQAGPSPTQMIVVGVAVVVGVLVLLKLVK